MLLVLTHVVDQHAKTFTIDEPEAHLHPHSQRVLADELVKSSSKNQFLIITHSPQFVDFKNLHSVVLVRENSGRSNVVKLPNDYLSKDEEAKASKIVWSEDKEFLFSRRVLLVEGETEYGAMPILAKKLGKSFDENGVSVVSVGGHHFGLFMKILKGFKFPFRVMCDGDLLMKVDGTVGSGIQETRSSSLFETSFQLGQLEDRELEILWDCQELTVSKTNKKGVKVDYYKEELFDELNAIARKLGFDVVSPDFEGYLKLNGYEQILKEAGELYGNNKILIGRFVAMTGQNVPQQLASIITEVVSL
jgi:predicted ATP-dependent endonuclease of OLD family